MSDDPIPRFHVEPTPKAGLIGRLFGRVPREAAFVGIRNILATTPLEEVRQSDIAAAFAKSRVHCREATKELMLIFEHAALLAAEDMVLSDGDRRGLAVLQRAFELTDVEATSAIENAIGQIFERILREALSDGQVTEQEKANLDLTAKALSMSDQQKMQLYQSAVQAAFSSAMADRRYTKNDETRINALAKSLGGVVIFDATTAGLVEKCKLLAQIDEGVLPEVSAPILLKRGETCHYFCLANHNQIKRTTKLYKYSGPAASIRIMKGLRWRFGAISLERLASDVMTQLDTGTLYITSTRLLFNGKKKNTSIPLGKITKFTIYKDGIKVEKDSGPNEYFLRSGDWEFAGACLEGAISKLRGEH